MAFLDDLKAELLAGHPVTGAYSADDFLAADELNVVNRTRNRPTVLGSEILNATDDVEFGALTDSNKGLWLDLCGVLEVDTSSGVAKSLEADLFGGGTTTRTSLAAVRNEDISRAVELGLGTIKVGNVTEARAF